VFFMRRRRERGLSVLPFGFAGKLQGSGRRNLARERARRTRQLRRTIEYAYRYVPFYRPALDASGVKPADIHSLADVHQLPITRKKHLSKDTAAFISRFPGLVPTTLCGTSGTTGKRLRLYLTTEELRYHAATRAIAGLLAGRLGPEHIVQINQPLARSPSTLVNSCAARLSGALVLPLEFWGSLDDHVQSIFQERNIPGKRPKVSGLYIYPSHLWALTRRAEEMGSDFRESGLEWIRTGSTSVTEDLRQRVLDAWGVALNESYGLNEAFTCTAAQCSQSNRLHFPDAMGYAEVLDAETAQPVPPGQPGVLTITSFYPYRELMPVLRYWTGDLVVLSPDPVCVCGAATTQLLDVVGRADHMVTVGAFNVYPQMVGDFLRGFAELALPPRFVLRTEERRSAVHAVLDVELRRALVTKEEHRLRERLETAIFLGRLPEVEFGSVKLVINLRPPGSVEHPFPYKMHEGGGGAEWVA
jgi:phenylacetate-CoA ligase